MGIPSYFKHIITSYREIIKELDNKLTVNNLYLDSNSIIYDVVSSIDKIDKNIEENIIKLVCNKIAYYIKEIKPNKKVIIAFDGVAPAAKLCQQRTRRYKTCMERQIFEKLGILELNKWNTIAITPGTKFMEKLDKKIKIYFKNSKKFDVEEIIVSGPGERGEGEHKIFEYIRDNKEYHNNSSSAIYGLDADLIMLSLNHVEYCKNIYLYRETPVFIKSIDSTLEPNKNYILDIPMMANKLVYELNTKKTIDNNNLIRDYIFIFFMMGNDFLPHFPSLNIRTDGIDRISCAYKETLEKCGHLTNNSTIIWKNMQFFIKYLSQQEERNFQTEHRKREKQNEKFSRIIKDDKDRYLNLPLLDRRKEIYINPFEDGWEYRYYNVLLNMERNDSNVQNIVSNYLEGLEWMLKYYTVGCVDWTWYYKYSYPPLLIDINPLTPYFNIDLLEEKNISLSSSVQLAFVLPKVYWNLINKNVVKKLQDKCTDINECKLEYAYCRYIWEAHVEGDFVELDEIRRIVAKI